MLCLGAQLARPLDPAKTLTQYAHRVWGQEEGLFQPTVYAITQGRDGFLWLGTQDSLIRFDGAHFREPEAVGAAALHGALIRSLKEDRLGRLWVATIGSGLFRFELSGQVTRFAAPKTLPSNNVFCLDQGRDGAMWACTEAGLIRFDGDKYRKVDPRPAFGTVHVTCEANGARWIGNTTGQLRELDASRVALQESGPITALQCSADGSVWAGTAKGVVHVLGERQMQLTTAEGLPDNAVNSLAESVDGSLWIGTDDGISRYKNGALSVYRTRDGLSHSVVLSMYVDREGTLWAGTKDGLDQFTDQNLTPYTVADGLSSNEAGPVVEDANGRLWVGTLDRGLNVYDGKRFDHIDARDGLLSNTILSLAAGSERDLWVGTARGLNHIVQGRVQEGWLRGQAIHTLFAGLGGSVTVGTDSGVVTVSRDGAARVLEQTTSPVLSIGQDAKGEMFSSGNGGQIAGVTRAVDCSYADKENRAVWLGTLGAGLIRLRDGAVGRVRVKDGLWDNRIYAIVPDGRGSLWFASSKGIFRIAARQLNDFVEGRAHAVTSVPFTTGQLHFECRSGVQPAATGTKDGRLWFATTSGVVVVDPNHLNGNPLPPPTAITAVLVNGERRSPDSDLHLRAFEKNIEIHYAGLSFVSPERVTFRYQLQGFDKGWINAGTRREAFFTNLPPREFEFRVQARSADGVWSDKPAVLVFSVRPWIYQRAWFFPLLATMMAFLGFAMYRRRVNAMERSFALVLAERSRIARELHDTLLQGLSGVTMQLQALWMRMPASQEKKTLHEIIDDAGQCSSEARKSVWGLRAQPSPEGYFAESLARLCRETLVHTPLQLELHIAPIALKDCPNGEHQLLRIAKEAINNAVKHADASRVRVMLHHENGMLEMTIADDGKGFDVAGDYTRGGHFGLRGMKERMAELSGTLVVESDEDGTRVTARAPLRVSRLDMEQPERTAG